MKRLLAFGLLLGVASVFAMAAPHQVSAESAKREPYHVGGFWTPTAADKGSFVVMNGDGRSAYLGFMRSANKSKACEFAIGVDRDEVHFQIVDKSGQPHFVPVTALLKLADKPKSSDTPVTQPAAKDDIPRGYKVLYAIARTRAAGELAKKENISRAAAREKIDSISDAELHAQVKAAGIAVAKDYPGEGKLRAIIDWLIEHQDAILAIVTLLLSLFA